MQFDDVMDDMNDDIKEDKEEAETLEKKLAEYGVTEFDRPGEYKDLKFSKGNYMQEAYMANQGEWHEWSEYVLKLRKMLEKYESEKKTE